MPREAVEALGRAMLIGGRKDNADLLNKDGVQFGYAAALERLRARNLTRLLTFYAKSDGHNRARLALQLAGAYVFVGNREKAFQWLERSYAEHEPVLPDELALGAIEPRPNFIAFADDHRFDEMLHRVKLASVKEFRAAVNRYRAPTRKADVAALTSSTAAR